MTASEVGLFSFVSVQRKKCDCVYIYIYAVNKDIDAYVISLEIIIPTLPKISRYMVLILSLLPTYQSTCYPWDYLPSVCRLMPFLVQVRVRTNAVIVCQREPSDNLCKQTHCGKPLGC